MSYYYEEKSRLNNNVSSYSCFGGGMENAFYTPVGVQIGSNILKGSLIICLKSLSDFYNFGFKLSTS